MGVAVFDHVVPFANQRETAAAVLSRDSRTSLLHTGIYFKNIGSQVCILHLGWENLILEGQQWPQGPRLWAGPSVAPERLDGIAAWCELVLGGFKGSETFPYGFGYPDAHIDDATGQCVSGPGARGLTCATLVLAVFRKQGIQLIDETDWPRRKRADLRFVRFVRGVVLRARRHAEKQLAVVRRLERDVRRGRIRFRPEEVIAACGVELPAKFANVREDAFRIRRLLPKRSRLRGF
jgi:hypothetical protein